MKNDVFVTCRVPRVSSFKFHLLRRHGGMSQFREITEDTKTMRKFVYSLFFFQICHSSDDVRRNVEESSVSMVSPISFCCGKNKRRRRIIRKIRQKQGKQRRFLAILSFFRNWLSETSGRDKKATGTFPLAALEWLRADYFDKQDFAEQALCCSFILSREKYPATGTMLLLAAF